MAASRFPGKPLHPILGRPMIDHVYFRAKMYSKWDKLVVATCDKEIEEHSNLMGFPVVMTGTHHTRALDRVAEAITMLDVSVSGDDIVICVQGDEPMMAPNMIDAVLAPLLANRNIPGTILTMNIQDESIWRNPDTVKLVHNEEGVVLYTSRAPIPYCKEGFDESLGAKRIYGIFAFRWEYLQAFTGHRETRLELLESCDSNRILDMNFRQYIAPYGFVQSYSVDSPSDIGLVEKHIVNDPYWASY